MEHQTEPLTIVLSGRIDSNNAAATERSLYERLAGKENKPVVLNAAQLSYLSSAGLRVLLHIKKTNPDLTITDVNSSVYEVLDMTGFTSMMNVQKAYRVISTEGCEEIGRGSNGIIYRIDNDTIVKVYRHGNTLEDIQHEREVAQLALILGIPTAISYDVVRVGDSYGSVFELLNARSFSKILANEPDRFDWCVKEYVDMLNRIHGTVVPKGKLPDMRETALSWVDFLSGNLPEASFRKLRALVEAVPQDDHLLHGDYHTKNLELQNGEVLLIDMDTLAVGHPIFELGSMFNSYIGFSEVDRDVIRRFQGFDFETGKAFWRRTLEAYLGTTDDRKIKAVEDRARIIGYARLIRRAVRRNDLKSETERAEYTLWKKELIELLETTDSLLFTRGEMQLPAVDENLPKVLSFLDAHLDGTPCSEKTRSQIALAAEEIFVNIASYAYAPGTGSATVRVKTDTDPAAMTITFLDNGIPYDPLKNADPDVTLSAEERRIGGLGIFLTRRVMDEVRYAYRDGQNCLTMKKYL